MSRKLQRLDTHIHDILEQLNCRKTIMTAQEVNYRMISQYMYVINK